MTDKELLEAAARAAGIEIEQRYEEPAQFRGLLLKSWKAPHAPAFWNPLTDDGDAMRLAVKMGICFGPNFDGDTAVAFGREGRNICEAYGNDQYAATRRAIVRAAAGIGSGHNARLTGPQREAHNSNEEHDHE